MADWEKLIEEHYEKKSKIDARTIYELVEQVLLEEGYQDSDIIKKHSSMRLSTKGTKKAGGEPFDEDPPKARSKSAPAGFGVLEEDMLEESTLNWSELNTYDWRLKKFYELLDSDEPVSWEMVDGTTVLIPKEKNTKLIAKLKAIVDNGEQLPGLIKVTTADGKVINTNKLKKTSEFGGGKMNQGDVAEGILGAAIYARFMYPDRLVTTDDIRAVLNSIAQIGSGSNPKKSEAILRGTVGEDKVNFKVALAPSNFAALISTNGETMEKLLPLYKSSAAYVNNEKIVDLAGSPDFDPKPNTVDITSDGVSDQKGTKVDVKVEIDGKIVRLGNISLKTLSNTMGQTGKSWNAQDKKGRKTGIVPFFQAAFGVRPSSEDGKEYNDAISAYMDLSYNADNTKTDEANAVRTAGAEVYKDIVQQVSNFRAVKADGEDNPAVSDKEAQFIENVVNGIKNAVTKGDDSVKLLSFGGGNYKLLDLTTLGDAMRDYNLKVSMPDESVPRILITAEGEGETLVFIQIRMKLESKPNVRHYFEKKPGLDKIFAIANEKAKEDSQEQK